MDEGRLTDSFGRKVDFRNTIVIMTSNVGVGMLKRQDSMGFIQDKGDVDYESMKKKLLDETKKVFRPEFLNRVDDTIVFHPLRRQDLEQIIHIELKEVRDRLKDKKMELVVTDEVLKFLIDEGYDPVFGARPLKRTIQKHIENVLAEEILSGKFKDGDKLSAELHGGRIVFEKAVAP
jgi:ATP-dependent Clp protease ATP-binding subunit ClpC